ncbi:MAG: exonuclease domain-containing protein [Lactovum sp.]
MTRYAVVDLEATDSSSKLDQKKKIIQIGIIILENGKIIDQFSSEVNPHESLTKKIVTLTGLTDEKLNLAPDFPEIIPEILKYLKGTTFVAHNVKFDWNLLSSSLAEYGYSLNNPRIDTVELSKIFFPRLEKYKLEFLKEELNLENSPSHTALSDARQTAFLLLKIQEKILTLPKKVLEEIQKHASSLSYETKSFIEELKDLSEEKEEEFNFLTSIALKRRESPHFERKIGQDFSKNIKKLGFEPRKVQKEIAEIISKDIKNKQASFIEATTGSGKTLAYLLSLLSEGENIILSTSTKILQEQLIQDLSLKFQKEFMITFSKLMGVRNYISLTKFQAWLQEEIEGQNTEIFKMKLLVWLAETETGELSELSKNATTVEMFEKVTSQGREGGFDFINRQVAQALQSDVIVINHAYLLELLKKDSELLENRVLVIDESQQLLPLLEKSNQKELDVLETILEVDVGKKRRTLDQLLSLLAQKELKREKILQIAADLKLENFLDFMSDSQKIYWMEENTLKSSLKDFYQLKRFLPPNLKTIFISASLGLSKEFVLLPRLLGFKKEEYQLYQLAVKQVKNQELISIEDGLSVKNSSVQDYSDFIVENLKQLVTLKYPIIVLFSSHDLLNWTAEKLQKEKLSIGIQQTNQHEILKHQFDEGRYQLLLVTAAFWEGVDFEKQEKIILVIPRLPFSRPDDILTRKFSSQFKNPFYDFNLPMATMKLLQAVGRVNRRKNQRSVVLVLDHRLSGKSYAKRIRRRLRDYLPVKKIKLEEVKEEIKNFLEKKNS